MNQTVLYHASCYDGFAAAWVLWGWGICKDADFLPISYSDPVPWEAIDGKDVIVADFSFKRPVMEEVIRRARSCVVLDHHKTAEEELRGLPGCVFDMEKSGGMLSFEYVIQQIHENHVPPHGDQYARVPWLVRYTEDRDLWRFKLPASLEVNEAIRSYPMDFKVWDQLETTFDQTGDTILRREGACIVRLREQYINTMRKFVRPGLVGDPQGDVTLLPMLNAPYFWISDVLNAICEDEEAAGRPPMAMAWFQRSDGKYQYSLRSKGEIDASLLAKAFGGGGHRNAAGFESDKQVWTECESAY